MRETSEDTSGPLLFTKSAIVLKRYHYWEENKNTGGQRGHLKGFASTTNPIEILSNPINPVEVQLHNIKLY